jgi:hypothetical protein
MADKKPTGLYAKMAAIMGQIDKVDKDLKMSGGGLNYKYVSDVQVYHTVRKLLVDHGIALFASMVEAHQERYVSSAGKDKNHTLAKFEFVLVDSETGDSMTCAWHGEADDSGDKGVNKSSTAALKFWLLKTFIIPTGDDPDDAASGQRTVPARTAPNPRRIPETPPPAAPEPSELDAHLGPRKPRKGKGSADAEPPPENPIEERAKVIADKTCPWDGAMRRQPWQDFIQMYPEWSKRFWPAVKALGMDNDMAHEALGVESMKDWKGTDDKNTIAHLWYALTLAAVESELVDDKAA